MERFLTIDELAKILNLNKYTIYGWCSKRKIPFVRCGRTIRFRLDDVLSSFKENRNFIIKNKNE